MAEQPTRLSHLLFPSPRGRVWNPDNFQSRVWRPAMHRAGADFTLYDLRHTFASRLLSAGIPLVEVSLSGKDGLDALEAVCRRGRELRSRRRGRDRAHAR